MSWMESLGGLLGSGENKKATPQFRMPDRKPVEGIDKSNFLDATDFASQIARNEMLKNQGKEKNSQMGQNLFYQMMPSQKKPDNRYTNYGNQGYSMPSSYGGGRPSSYGGGGRQV